MELREMLRMRKPLGIDFIFGGSNITISISLPISALTKHLKCIVFSFQFKNEMEISKFIIKKQMANQDIAGNLQYKHGTQKKTWYSLLKQGKILNIFSALNSMLQDYPKLKPEKKKGRKHGTVPCNELFQYSTPSMDR